MTLNTPRGYPYPEPTDLVTDGAAAIEALAEAVDDDMAARIADDGALAALIDARIAAALVDAKGDLIVATAADVVDRLAVGADGQVLMADSTQAKGVKWATPSSGGSMINQTIRGTIALAASSSVDATIAAVDMAKTQLRHLGQSAGFGTPDSDEDNQIRVKLQATTKVRAERGGGVNNTNNVNYELTEWT